MNIKAVSKKVVLEYNLVLHLVLTGLTDSGHLLIMLHLNQEAHLRAKPSSTHFRLRSETDPWLKLSIVGSYSYDAVSGPEYLSLYPLFLG